MAFTVFFKLVVYINVNSVGIYHEKSQWNYWKFTKCVWCCNFHSFNLRFKYTLLFIKKIALNRAITIYKLLHVGSGNSCCVSMPILESFLEENGN